MKRLIIKDSVEERILANRRSLAADQPTVSTLVDGTGSIENEAAQKGNRRERGQRQEEAKDEQDEQRFQRLHHLEALFGCSATIKIHK